MTRLNTLSDSLECDASASARLTIHLDRIAQNWCSLSRLAAPGACAGVVKADAYGLGIAPVAKALHAAGCETFFVATPQEGVALRVVLGDARIFILDGVWPESLDILRRHRLSPVIGTWKGLELWAMKGDAGLRPALHVDTGMNRLGFAMDDVAILANHELVRSVNPQLIMSHLACADTPEHPLNGRQIAAFGRVREAFPRVPASLANSAGTLLGGPFIHDLARPGVALFGGASAPDPQGLIKPVVHLEARILQTRHVPQGQSIGYGAAQHTTRDSRIAIVGLGYADGLPRLTGARDDAPGLCGFIGDETVPCMGRISMDLTAFDVTDVSEARSCEGQWISILNDHQGIDDLAAHAHTIGYEILTSLGQRFARHYRTGM